MSKQEVEPSTGFKLKVGIPTPESSGKAIRKYYESLRLAPKTYRGLTQRERSKRINGK